MDAPEARYLDRDGALLAYQVIGDHGPNTLWVGEIAQHFDLAWTDPYIHELYERSGAYAQTVYLQMRGFGLSERIRYTPTVDQHADDLLAVLDATGVRDVTVAGSLTTCMPILLAAAREPSRFRGLVLYRPLPCGPSAPGALGHGWTHDTAAEYAARWRAAFARWGSGDTISVWDPVQNTGYNRRLMAMLERCSATPAGADSYLEYALSLDISDVIRTVQTPTRVLYSPTCYEPEAIIRRTSELLPNATFHVLAPTPPGAAIGEAWLPVWDHVEEVATGGHHQVGTDRFLGTVLFTDLVGSTELLARVGDAHYREIRSAHERQVRLLVEQAGGRLISVVGDGTFSIFDGPTSAARCAVDVCAAMTELGLVARAGLHTGELQRTGRDVTGLAVHIGARVAAAAGPGEVLVSRTVRDLVVGSGLGFAERGTHELKGVPEPWQLYALADAGDAMSLPIEESLERPLDRAALKTARAAPRVARAAVRFGNAVQRYRGRARADDFAQ